jgi:hypothetical protein
MENVKNKQKQEGESCKVQKFSSLRDFGKMVAGT